MFSMKFIIEFVLMLGCYNRIYWLIEPGIKFAIISTLRMEARQPACVALGLN